MRANSGSKTTRLVRRVGDMADDADVEDKRSSAVSSDLSKKSKTVRAKLLLPSPIMTEHSSVADAGDMFQCEAAKPPQNEYDDRTKRQC